MVLFWQPPGFLVQWTPSPFQIAGVAYSCAEQWMMACKARLFNARDVLAQILATADPEQHKRLGRAVPNFNSELWERHSLQVVIHGNYAKFTQNAALRRELVDTGSRLLVEASPHDRVWGIGLAANDPKALDERRWRGTNKLGQALMVVRQLIVEGREPSPPPEKALLQCGG
ncbi:hypothetical protein JKP88DRAFT_271192 [Tribonema minus]|uniref:NADAR domain-containing protein n=1 Tax=Tribonema minus TaxID=303371 RepID=A0A836CP42_9STRA|nr:hypothetical protein JKP88DRAFT_271192 [Tribonema minus]